MTGWSLTIAMKKSKFTESQIVFALQQDETGARPETKGLSVHRVIQRQLSR
jgi:hypothetical protein